MELGQGQYAWLSFESVSLIRGDPIGVPVSRACPKGGAVHAGATIRGQLLGADRKSADGIVVDPLG